MTISKYLKLAALLLVAAGLFSACKKDQNKPEHERVTSFDDLAFFQDAFVEVDASGNLVAHCVGEPIYTDDPTHLYIGVDDLEEALSYWDDCLAPDIVRTVSVSHNYTYTLTDLEGKSQGTVSFALGTGGSVAEITTNAPGLKHFDRVTFLLNSAWPFNSEAGEYLLGDVLRSDVTVGGDGIRYQSYDVGFVCVREKGNGVKPLFVAISKEEYEPSNALLLLTSDYCPGEAKAKNIAKLLQTDWPFFAACFEDAGQGKLEKDRYYWFDDQDWIFVAEYQYAIKLYDGSIDRWDFMWSSPKKNVLLKIDWLN